MHRKRKDADACSTIVRSRTVFLLLACFALVMPTAGPDCDRELNETDCTDGVDNDCDGANDCAACGEIWVNDVNGDGAVDGLDVAGCSAAVIAGGCR